MADADKDKSRLPVYFPLKMKEELREMSEQTGLSQT